MLLVLSTFESKMRLWNGSSFSKSLCHVRLPVKSSDNVKSKGLVDPKGGSSVTNFTTLATLAACREVDDLSISPVLGACWLEFKGDFPLLVQGRKGCQKSFFL